jgi:hypothetical protein
VGVPARGAEMLIDPYLSVMVGRPKTNIQRKAGGAKLIMITLMQSIYFI